MERDPFERDAMDQPGDYKPEFWDEDIDLDDAAGDIIAEENEALERLLDEERGYGEPGPSSEEDERCTSEEIGQIYERMQDPDPHYPSPSDKNSDQNK